MCEYNPAEAIEILISLEFPSKYAEYKVKEFSKLIKRIKLDLKQKIEQNNLIFKQSIENDYLENSYSNISNIIDITKNNNYSAIINNSYMHFGDNNYFIENQENIEFRIEDKEIINLINKSDIINLEKKQLISELLKLKDEKISEKDRKKSQAKLKEFLYKITEHASKISIGIAIEKLIDYIISII